MLIVFISHFQYRLILLNFLPQNGSSSRLNDTVILLLLTLLVLLLRRLLLVFALIAIEAINNALVDFLNNVFLKNAFHFHQVMLVMLAQLHGLLVGLAGGLVEALIRLLLANVFLRLL